MGTRSLTHVKDDGPESKTLVTIYRQFDGYPTGMGKALADFLSGRKVVNGIWANDREIPASNGMGCLAASLIKALKDGTGNIYIYPTDSKDCGEGYTYTIYLSEENELCMKCQSGYPDPSINKPFFNGPAKDFDAEKIEKEL